jgi:choline dehydrogenase-like flavoprotein
MPDGEFLPPFEMNCVEQHMSKTIADNYPDRHLVHGRWAHLTEPKEHHLALGRGKCQSRNLCMRGCPFGAYFSSNSSTLPAAKKTENLTILSDAVVVKIIYDDDKKKAMGIEYIDTTTGERQELKASIVFVNASALNSNLILLNSTSERFPNGLGNDHDILGRYIGFHNYRGWTSGKFEGFKDTYVYGRNPSELILANYRNVYKHDMPFVGGYTIFSGASRPRNQEAPENGPGIGADYKENLRLPGEWQAYMYMQGETIPKASNRVYLSKTEKDPWGIPQLVTDVNYDDNDELMVQDFLTESKAMFETMGCTAIEQNDSKQAPGLDIHEMGGCRMGTDPKTSMLNEHNQLHLCKNVFVTDGACMTSTGNQSPSLLYMALTARAATYAAEQLKAQQL